MKNRPDINVVWIKRDIRSQDHAALDAAEKACLPYLVVYIFDEDVMQHPDCSARHLQFQYHSLLNLQKRLESVHFRLFICKEKTQYVFEKLVDEFNVKQVFSYQESGIELTYKIDKKLKRLFTSKGIAWTEFQRDGIIRGLKNRETWTKSWFGMAHSQVIKNEYQEGKTVNWQNPFPLNSALLEQIKVYPKEFQPAGEDFAWRYLKNFTAGRIQYYSRHISKPELSRLSCSRLSPYLAWGNISIRQVYQYVISCLQENSNKSAHKNFLTRLTWHCHFIQKFETVCTYEFKSINGAFEEVWNNKNEAFIKAWEEGRTGYPLVDAAMRCVRETGWINFRMRALLVSFLTHHLFQDWRQGVYHLAKQFLDYEPGIHYTQFQMQSGSTGVNTIRVYNPVLNSHKHDEDAVFIKRWCPELAHLPLLFIHEPWKMNPMEESFYNFRLGVDYPNPIVRLEETRLKIKSLYEIRKTDLAKLEESHTVKYR